MNHEIRPLTQKEELAAYARIAFDAYPGFGMEDAAHLEAYLVKIAEKAGSVRPFGAFRHGNLTGGMLVYDYSMNYRGAFLPVGGVGLVAVDLLHKKEHVCKDLITSFILESRDRGRLLTLLYPFRPDFYYKLGYGYGSPIYEYRVRTENFTQGSTKEGLEHASAEDREAMARCYNQVAGMTHGMIKRSGSDMGRLLAKKGHHAVAVREKGDVTGYVIYKFESVHKNNFVVNDLVIIERMETTPQSRERLNTFLGGQRDQCAYVTYRTFDAEEYHLLADPRDPSGDLVPEVYHSSHRGAVGLMYRIGDIEGFFREADFPAPRIGRPLLWKSQIHFWKKSLSQAAWYKKRGGCTFCRERMSRGYPWSVSGYRPFPLLSWGLSPRERL